MSALQVYSRIKLAASKDPEIGLPAMLAMGTGGGLVAGAGVGLLENIDNLTQANKLNVMLPELEALRDTLRVGGLDNRKKVLEVLRTPGLPNEMYYPVRQAYERGLLQRSRAAKTLKVLKTRIGKGILRSSLAGTALGVGAGLLGATALGHFD